MFLDHRDLAAFPSHQDPTAIDRPTLNDGSTTAVQSRRVDESLANRAQYYARDG